jgi:hypothetical protein
VKSLILMAATLLPGQVVGGQLKEEQIPPPKISNFSAQVETVGPVVGVPVFVDAVEYVPCEEGGFLRRLQARVANCFAGFSGMRSLFGSRADVMVGPECASCQQGSPYPPGVVVMSGPQMMGAAPAIMQAGATEPAVLPAGVRKSYADKVGHEADYSWITGQLFFVHADGGLWVLRYAGVDSEDRYGGSVVLSPSVSMRNFREGDLVSVRGEIVGEGRASRSLGAPLYRPSAIDMIERAD